MPGSYQSLIGSSCMAVVTYHDDDSITQCNVILAVLTSRSASASLTPESVWVFFGKQIWSLCYLSHSIRSETSWKFLSGKTSVVHAPGLQMLCRRQTFATLCSNMRTSHNALRDQASVSQASWKCCYSRYPTCTAMLSGHETCMSPTSISRAHAPYQSFIWGSHFGMLNRSYQELDRADLIRV